MKHFSKKIEIALNQIYNDKTLEHHKSLKNIIDDIQNDKFEIKRIFNIKMDYDFKDGIIFNEEDITDMDYLYMDKEIHEIIDKTEIDDIDKYIYIDIKFIYTDRNEFLKNKNKMIELYYKYNSIDLKFDAEKIKYWKQQHNKKKK